MLPFLSHLPFHFNLFYIHISLFFMCTFYIHIVDFVYCFVSYNECKMLLQFPFIIIISGSSCHFLSFQNDDFLFFFSAVSLHWSLYYYFVVVIVLLCHPHMDAFCQGSPFASGQRMCLCLVPFSRLSVLDENPLAEFWPHIQLICTAPRLTFNVYFIKCNSTGL